MSDIIEEQEEGLCMDDFQWRDDDVRYRFENTTDGHFKFYEITLAENGPAWTLYTAYGSMKAGAHVTHKSVDFSTKWWADEEMYMNHPQAS